MFSRLCVFVPIFAFMAMALPQPVAASSFMECEAKGVVQKLLPKDADTDPVMAEVKVNWATVVGGFAGIGMPCLEAIETVEVDITKKPELKAGDAIELRYMTYSGMGSEGPVSSKTWKLPEEK